MSDKLSPNQLADFQKFEGNANAFRILTHRYNESEPGGYKLTFTTLASIVKYPSSSAAGFDRSSGLIARKKSGFFDSELDTFAAIAAALQLPKVEGHDAVYARHPFVYLVEAADDICYRVIDLEDAHRLGVLSLEGFKQLFLSFFENETDYNSLDYVKRKLEGIVDDNQQAQFIRAKWIGLMIAKLSEAFLENESLILSGGLERSLLECLAPKDCEKIARINQFSQDHVYRSKAVLEIEVAGYHVIGGLLQSFVSAVLKPSAALSGSLLRLIPRQFAVTGASLYHDVQSVVDFISGMTDLYALDLYRKITGISIPEIK